MSELFRTKDAGFYDLAVAYRIYPGISKGAPTLPFGDNKLRQAEICLRSFRKALGSLRAKVWAILDGCPIQYRELFQRYFAPSDLALVELKNVGNKATFGKQLDILLAQDDAEFVYFAEDDYLYLPDSLSLLVEFLRHGEQVDFVTPYDHPYCYQVDLHREPKWVRVFGEHHWRTASSTCLTFLTRKSTLAKYERTLRTYCRKNDDCAMWLSLTKRRVFDPVAMLRYFALREFYRNIPVKAWVYCWPQILFGRAAKLWLPIPAFATHLCSGLLSPGNDWVGLMRREAERQAIWETNASAETQGRYRSK